MYVTVIYFYILSCFLDQWQDKCDVAWVCNVLWNEIRVRHCWPSKLNWVTAENIRDEISLPSSFTAWRSLFLYHFSHFSRVTNHFLSLLSISRLHFKMVTKHTYPFCLFHGWQLILAHAKGRHVDGASYQMASWIRLGWHVVASWRFLAEDDERCKRCT